MTRAWAGVLSFSPEVVRIEPDPRLAVIAPPNEAAIVSSFDISGAITGRMQLTIPFAAVEPAKKLLSDPPRIHSGGDLRFTDSLCQQLSQVKVELCAQLGRTVLPLSRLLALEVGDVLTLDTEEGHPIPIFVEGREKFAGMPRAAGGSHAVVLERGLALEHNTH
jgi:flagellar motor switch protein FliM